MGLASVDRTLDFRRLAGVDVDNGAVPMKRKSAFLEEAAELRQSLGNLEALVRAVRPKYAQPSLFLRVKGSAKMSEREKDEFDADITELVKNCGFKIDALQDATLLPHASSRRVEHEKEVVTYLLERLKAIAAAAKAMQKQRAHLPFLLSHRLLPEDERKELADKEDALVKALAAKASASARRKPAVVAEPEATLSSPSLVKRRPARAPAVQHAPVFASQNDDVEFTETQTERFHMENITLHRHFQENLEDAKQMEAKMAEISNLMAQFTDNVMQQQDEIEMIHNNVHETTNNLRDSAKTLEQTHKIGSGYGFMIFCFYAFFSLLLHLLHYFNS